MSRKSSLLWDLPTRVCHWLFVVVIAFSWWSAEYDQLEWHTRSGYTLLTLLLFRIAWGVFGSQSARFSRFIRSPQAVYHYALTLFRKDTAPSVGHNPMGGWSVVLLLLLMLAQVLLGLFSEDVDGLASGPLSYWVSYDFGRWAAKTHEDLFNVLLGFIAAHITFVLFYVFYKRDNLIKPMIIGVKENIDASALSASPLWLAISFLICSGVFVWWLVT